MKESYCEVIGCEGDACWRFCSPDDIDSEEYLCNNHMAMFRANSPQKAAHYVSVLPETSTEPENNHQGAVFTESIHLPFSVSAGVISVAHCAHSSFPTDGMAIVNATAQTAASTLLRKSLALLGSHSA